MGETDELSEYIGAKVVVDTDAGYIYIGRLERTGRDFLELSDADVHDASQSHSTKELYAIETLRLGVRANRKRVLVKRSRIVSVSRLDEVIEY
jgi:hypothetical protein